MSEYRFVEKPFLDHLASLGWKVIPQGCGGILQRGCLEHEAAKRYEAHEARNPRRLRAGMPACTSCSLLPRQTTIRHRDWHAHEVFCGMRTLRACTHRSAAASVPSRLRVPKPPRRMCPLQSAPWPGILWQAQVWHVQRRGPSLKTVSDKQLLAAIHKTASKWEADRRED